MSSFRLPFALLILALLALGTAVAAADDNEPGEYLRYVTVDGQRKSYFIERVLDVREGEVLWEVAKTNEDASKDQGRVRLGWVKIPELKPLENQRVMEDEMVWLDAAGKKLWCRHVLVEEPIDPDIPERKRTKDVWYSNDVPCSGRVKSSLTNRDGRGLG